MVVDFCTSTREHQLPVYGVIDMGRRKQIFGIASGQCGSCIHGQVSDLFDGETLCHNKCDTILYPEITGTVVCPYLDEGDDNECS